MFVIDPALPVGTTLNRGKHRLEDVLGKGSFGITYKAIEVETGRTLAVKELFPDGMAQRLAGGFVHIPSEEDEAFEELIEGMRRERAVLAQIKNLATTFTSDYWEENGTAYLAMEYLDGETLEARIARGALLSNDEALQILNTLLPLLEKVHLMGLLHRDIKPANIVLSSHGPELIDFGSATPFMLGQRVKVTSRLLTPAYAPLEQYGQEVMIGPATDLYALSATLYEALTGTRVPNALDRANGAKLNPVLAVKHDVDPLLAKILERGLEMQMELRPQQARQMVLTATKKSSHQNSKSSVISDLLFIGNLCWQRALHRDPEVWMKVLAIPIAVVIFYLALPLLLNPNNPFLVIKETAFFQNSKCNVYPKKYDYQRHDILLVSFDDNAFEVNQRIVGTLKKETGLRFSAISCVSPKRTEFKKGKGSPTWSLTHQDSNELLALALDNMTHSLADSVAIGVTSDDLYTQKTSKDAEFGVFEAWEGGKGAAIVSAARMDPVNYGQPINQELLEQRLRKMILRYVGLLFHKKEKTNDPKSLMFGPLVSLEDLDAREERF